MGAEPPGTPRNPRGTPLNHTRNPRGTPRGTPLWNPTRPTPLGACGAPYCLSWHLSGTGSRYPALCMPLPDKLRDLLVGLGPHPRASRRIAVEKAQSTQRRIHVLRHRRAAEALRVHDLLDSRNGHQEMVNIIVQHCIVLLRTCSATIQ